MRKIGLFVVLFVFALMLSMADAATWTEKTVVREVSRVARACSGAVQAKACSGARSAVKASCSRPQRVKSCSGAVRAQAVRVVRVRSKCPGGVCP